VARIKDTEAEDMHMYYLNLLNPFHPPAFVSDPSKEGFKESLENTMILGSLFGAAAYITYGMSSPGIRTHPGTMGMVGVKKHIYEQMSKYGARFVNRLVTVGSNPLFMITASTAAHAYTSSEIEKMHPGVGAQMSLATQYANTGSSSGGSMPVVWGLPGYNPGSLEDHETQTGKSFLEDLWMTATGGVW
jgi:hypothetical protein